MKTNHILIFLVFAFLSSQNTFGNNGSIFWITIYRTINGEIEQENIDPSQSGVPEIIMDEGGYLKVLVWQDGGTPPYKYAVWGFGGRCPVHDKFIFARYKSQAGGDKLYYIGRASMCDSEYAARRTGPW